MSNIKARLSVLLKAEDVIVAESEDPALWQQVFGIINKGKPFEPDIGATESNREESLPPDAEKPRSESDSALGRFAGKLGLSPEIVAGACDPTSAEPFLHLDMHAWSAVKSQLPKRGAKALSPIAVAGTLLALWSKEAGLATPTQAQVQKVLETISLQDKNPSRGIRSSAWLQARAGGQIVLNPAAIQKALLLAKCFCAKDWKPWNTSED